ncbi:Uncharacterized protein dnm_052130 [Desulfonema magnum]|uniref:Uncharacterized protein n=1 Tax=Desulfonema magnum TaxID=45655 RepID=A0A975BNW9_9BACT|nr:Uncharacterized protein dnm_052130 [Desulfonema magnum]
MLRGGGIFDRLLQISTGAKVFYISFFCERRRNPGFSFRGGGSFREKTRVSSRANIKNFCSATYVPPAVPGGGPRTCCYRYAAPAGLSRPPADIDRHNESEKEPERHGNVGEMVEKRI